jgi:hypothetical protein
MSGTRAFQGALALGGVVAFLSLHSFSYRFPTFGILKVDLFSHMQSPGRPENPTPPSGMILPDKNRPFTPPRTLVLCFDGTGNQFDAVVRHDTDSGVCPCVACLPSLVEHEYCTILHFPGERRQGSADGLLPGSSNEPHDLQWYHGC